MAKYRRTFMYLGLLVMFLLALLLVQGCAGISLKATEPGLIETAPLTGLIWWGQPCSMIRVPANMPKEFILDAHNIMTEQHHSCRRKIVELVFITSDNTHGISAFATSQCPGFILLNWYNYKTERDRSFAWNVAGNIREITSDQHTAIMQKLNSELADEYCLKYNLRK